MKRKSINTIQIIKSLICWLLLLNLQFEFIESKEFQAQKKFIHHRGFKSNKAAKRQEKSSTAIKLTNSDEPEFEYPSTTPISQLYSNDPIQRSIPIQVSAVLGQNAILPCSVRNIGVYNILWLRLKDGDVLAFDNMTITQDQRFKFGKKTINESNLLIEGVKSSDSGEYACQINTQNVKSKIIYLTVYTPPAFLDPEFDHDHDHDISNHHLSHLGSVKSQNHRHHNHNKEYDHSWTKSISVVEGKQVSLECNAFGQPKPIINWYVKRFKSDNLTVYCLNSSKIHVNNVMRNQYEYFECEATNKIPPSVSKKFRINVLYRPEVFVSPSKVYVLSTPTQVRFNCTVSAYPEASIIWMYNFRNLRGINNEANKRLRQTNLSNNLSKKDKKMRIARTTRSSRSINDIANVEFYHYTDVNSKYKINEYNINETLKQSSIVINVQDENDFGAYECFSNNSAGSKAVKFYIYGDFKEQSKVTTQSNLINPETSTEYLIPSETKALVTTPLLNHTILNVYTEEIIISRKDNYLNEDTSNSIIRKNEINKDSILNNKILGKKDIYRDDEANSSTSAIQNSPSQDIDDMSKPISFLESLFSSSNSVSSSSSSSFYFLTKTYFCFLLFLLFNSINFVIYFS